MKDKIYLSHFLHIYQPPNQDDEVIFRVIKESYIPFFTILKNSPNYKITLNISGCLIEKLEACGYLSFLKKIKSLINQGKIELVSTAKYHAILPLLPENEIKRQIELNDKIITKIFGKITRTKGFFLPEMCYSLKVAKLLKKMGFEWIILDEISRRGRLERPPRDKISIVRNLNLKVVFRDRFLSEAFGVKNNLRKKIYKHEIGDSFEKEQFVVLATDGEVFGHQNTESLYILKDLIKNNVLNKNITFLTISELIRKIKKREIISPVKSSWASLEEDYKKTPYPLWYNRKNKIHSLEWSLAKLAIKSVNSLPSDPNFAYARAYLDRGLHSCLFWWSSAEPYWYPDYISENILELIKSIRSLEKLKKSIKIKGEDIYSQIIKEIWRWHWSGKAKEKIDLWDKKISKFAKKYYQSRGY